MKLSTVAARNIFRNKRRSVLSATAIAVAALSITFLFSLLAGMKQDLAYNLQTYVTGEIRLRNPRFSEHERLNPLHLALDAPEALLAAVDDTEAVTTIAPRIRFPGSIFLEDENYHGIGMGVDFERERAFQRITDRLVSGRLPEGGNETLMGSGLARELDLSLGDTFTVLTKTATRASNAMTFEVVGLGQFPVGAFTESHFLVPIDQAQYFLRMPDKVTDLLVKTDGSVPLTELAGELQESLSAISETPLVAEAWTEQRTTYSFMEIADISYGIIALFFFILGSSVIVNTTMMVVYERTKEIGTLSAMGMDSRDLMRMFFLEALFISAAGAAVGVLLGIGVVLPFSAFGIDFGASLEGIDFEVSNTIYPMITLRSTAFVFAYSVVVAALASLLPSRRAARVSPAEALRSL